MNMLFAAAKIVLARHCKSETIPSMKKKLIKALEIAKIDTLTDSIQREMDYFISSSPR